MIAATDAEASEPAFAHLGVSEELSGGADAMYLREIANHDLLTQQDEIALAQRMEAGRAAAARAARSARRSTSSTRARLRAARSKTANAPGGT